MVLHLVGRRKNPTVLRNNSQRFAIESYPGMGDIILFRAMILRKLPIELVDLILDIAEYWPHTTTILKDSIRAFGPFTWRWNGGTIDYSKQWCPSGPAYAHRWSRWGESRLENSFIFRSPRLGVQPSRIAFCKRIMPERAYSFLSQIIGTCNTSRNWIPPRGIRAARKIVFEISCHQDQFGASSHDYHNPVRLFCDVGINRQSIARIKPSKQSQNSPDLSKVRSKLPKQGPLITYKPLVVERWYDTRHSRSRTSIMIWNYNDDQPNDPIEAGFITAKQFMKQLEVGDSIGVWARVAEGESYHIIDGMRMHVFWAV